MANENQGSWRRLQLRRMEYLYGQRVKRWEGRHTDDRETFCGVYRAMEAALRSLPAEPTLYVQAAMNEKMKADRAMLDRIAARFDTIEQITGRHEAASHIREAGA